MDSRQDRRRFRRARVNHSISIRMGDGESAVYSARLVDLGQSGLRCVGDLPAVSRGANVIVTLASRRWLVVPERIEVPAVVSRVETNQSDWVLELHPADENTVKRLDAYVSRSHRAQDRLVEAQGSSSPLAESLRMIQVQLATLDGERSRVVVITSAVAGEGKSFLSAGLAVIVAREGRRVLLVDGDLYAPSLHEAFALPPSAGVARLMNTGSVAELVAHVQPAAAGVWVLAAKPEATPSAFYNRASIARLLAGVRASDFDVVIIDSPPLLEAAGSVLLAKAADDTLLAVRSGRSLERDLRRAKALLDRHEVALRGVILNDVYGINQTPYGGSGRTRTLARWSRFFSDFGETSPVAAKEERPQRTLKEVTTAPANQRRA